MSITPSPRDQTSNSHPWFVFVAGINGSAATLVPLGQEMEKRGYRVILFEHCDEARSADWVTIYRLAEALRDQCYLHKTRLPLNFDARAWLPSLAMPTLVFAGENDRLTPETL